MKKVLAIIFCTWMLLSLFAGCAQGGNETTTGAPEILKVGYGRADITPKESVPLYGYADSLKRYSTGVLDSIYASCTAFQDSSGNTVLTFTQDWTSTFAEPVLWAKKDISDETGIPMGQIMVTSTHMHSGPDAHANVDPIQRYNTYYREQMVEAAKAAIADLKECEIQIKSIKLEGFNFVRHYVMNDGSIVGDQFGTAKDKTYVGHVHDADNEMQILRFKREGAKDIMMVNWQMHPHRAASANYYLITADVIGAMRTYVEANMDCHFAYYTGASGNVNPGSRIKEENATADYLEQGQEMGKAAIAACEEMTTVKGGAVKILKSQYTAKSEKNGVKKETVFDLHTVTIGDVGFAYAPYEMFDTNGKQIKEGSPFAMTFVCTMANIGNGYVAEEAAYEYGGYEVEYRGYLKGTAEELANQFVSMLKELKGTEK